MSVHRRSFLERSVGGLAAVGSLAAGIWPLSACQPERTPVRGGFVGIDPARGHRIRDRQPTLGASNITHRTADVLIVGGGIAGLSAARALVRSGVEDFHLLELQSTLGGNAGSTVLGGMAAPTGAHYLPVPTDRAPLIQDWLEEIGIRRRVSGRWEYDERHLCHSPQERLHFRGHWQEGLVPMAGVGASTVSQYERFSTLIARARQDDPWAAPWGALPVSDRIRQFWSITMADWLKAHGLDDEHLLWYLNYACRDDYGAGIQHVSAWAGIHYFASRTGFHAPGEAKGEAKGEVESLLTWPEGNHWLVDRMVPQLSSRYQCDQAVTSVRPLRQGVEVDVVEAGEAASGAITRWMAKVVVMAIPAFVAARVVAPSPAFLSDLAKRTRYAPWVVVNALLSDAPRDVPGAAPSWDNVTYGTRGLGYIDAGHQSLAQRTGARVLTWYLPLGEAGDDGRRQVLERPWQHWRDLMLSELAVPHPDLPDLVEQVAVARYGHAMAMPLPTREIHPDWQADRLAFAHSDWSGYSVFEEAFSRGDAAGVWAAARLRA